MSWRGTGTSNADLVANLKKHSVIKSDVVEQAMLQVDRGNFAEQSHYADSPSSIGYNTTISAPHMHAHALDALKDHLVRGENALDIGSGSGYLTACMGLMVGEEGISIGIDHIPELVSESKRNLKKGNADLLASGCVLIKEGDGRRGYPAYAPYNAIHVGAAAPTPPQALLDQLKHGGRMIIPIGPKNGAQELEQIDKLADGTIKRASLMGVRYGSLQDKATQLA